MGVEKHLLVKADDRVVGTGDIVYTAGSDPVDQISALGNVASTAVERFDEVAKRTAAGALDDVLPTVVEANETESLAVAG